jgi:5'-3' exonuclease
VLDANYLCHQARHAVGQLQVEEVQTGVIYGFFARMHSLARMFQSSWVVACWDSSTSFRKDIFKGYKAHRHDQELTEEQQEDLDSAFRQMNFLNHKALPAIGIPSFQAKGYEADDLMAGIAKESKRRVILITADNDMLQCLRPGVCLYNPSSKVRTTVKDFELEYELKPKDWVKVKVLAGCPTDEVPGVKGVGVITAVRFLHGKLPDGKKKEAILAQPREDAVRNVALCELPFRGAPVPVIPDKREFNLHTFLDLCHHLRFESFINDGGEWECFADNFWEDANDYAQQKHSKGGMRK